MYFFLIWSALHYTKKLIRLCPNHIEVSKWNPILRDLRMIRNGHLTENKTQLKKLKKKFLHTKQVSKASITGVKASKNFVQYLSWKNTCMGWRGNGINPKSIESLQLTACLSLNNLPFKLNQITKRSLLMSRIEKVLGLSN